MQLAIVIFEGFTALDAIGPNQVLAHTPGIDPVIVAEQPGPVLDNRTLTVVAERGLADVPRPDVVVVAGGVPAVHRATEDDPIVRWLAQVAPTTTWMTSVCTGSLLLGAAGLLRGRRATSHWYTLDRLSAFGATPVEDRYVVDGRVITAAGVSAGIDMALDLAARLSDPHMAQMLQLDLEYAPSPPPSTPAPRAAHPPRSPPACARCTTRSWAPRPRRPTGDRGPPVARPVTMVAPRHRGRILLGEVVVNARESNGPQVSGVRCLHCQGTDLVVEEARLPTKWNARTHLIELHVCQGCRFVMPFYVKKSWVTNN